MSLDHDITAFEGYMQKATSIIIKRYENLENAKAYKNISPREIASWFDEDLPENEGSILELLEFVDEKVVKNTMLNIGPRMFAYVSTSGTQASILAEMFVAALSQNVGKWHLSPVMSEIEKKVIKWVSGFIGYDPNPGGIFTSGGSAANLTGLTVARNIFFKKQNVRKKGLFSMKPFMVYASVETHGCIDKSIEQLGIGSENIRKIEVNDDYAINTDILRKRIEEDIERGFQPFCIVGNAGTINTGAIDPLSELSGIAKQFDMWFHVDGAFGGLAASLDTLKEKYRGIELADSIAIDFHKWLYQPYEAACTLVKNWDILHNSFYKNEEYLSYDRNNEKLDFNEYGFQLSRAAKAFKVWMTFKSYGTTSIKNAIQADIDNAEYLANLLEKLEDFELLIKPTLSAVCFRYIDNRLNERQTDELNKAILNGLEEDGRFFIAGSTLNGRPIIRACIINHRTKQHHVIELVDVITEIAKNEVAKMV